MKNIITFYCLLFTLLPVYSFAQTDTTHNMKVVKPENIDPGSKGTLKIMEPDTTNVEKMDPSKDTIDQNKMDNMDPKKNIKMNSL